MADTINLTANGSSTPVAITIANPRSVIVNGTFTGNSRVLVERAATTGGTYRTIQTVDGPGEFTLEFEGGLRFTMEGFSTGTSVTIIVNP